MKLNYKNQDLKAINWHCGPMCLLCVFYSSPHLHYCRLFCYPNKRWIKDTFNSDIFRL